LYVESAWRRQGIGSLLVDRLIREGAKHYQLLTLRTDTPAADKFYQKLGFKTQPNWKHTTHHLQLGEMKYFPLS
jgi:GNAT superfamily N-acetyltransferase